MVTVNDVPDTLAFMVLADTRFVAKAQMAALAREIEAVAVSAALDRAVTADVGVALTR